MKMIFSNMGDHYNISKHTRNYHNNKLTTLNKINLRVFRVYLLDFLAVFRIFWWYVMYVELIKNSS